MATASKKYKNIDPDLKAFVVETIYEVLNDPDRGLDLTEKTKRRLRAAKSKQKTVSLAEIRKKYY